MATIQTRFVPLLVTVASVLLGSVESTPSPQSIPSSRGPPPPLPQYYPSSSQRPPTSSLAPTAPIVYSAQRIRPSDYTSTEDEEPYPSTSQFGTARTTSGVAGEESPENSGFVEPIDFGSLLKNVGSSPKNPNLEIGASSSNPLFASESKDTFAGFFGSTKNPFEELTRLNTASSDHASRQTGNEENVGFVDPNVQFRSLFDSTGSAVGFSPQDFLGSKSENVGSDPSKGSQTRAYPSFTYSGRDADREDSDYNRGPPPPEPNRYRSSYRQVGNDYDGGDRRGHYDDRISHDSPPTDSYEDDRSGGSYYDGPPGRGPGGPPPPPPPQRGGGRDYERATPRYQTAQETSHAPQTKPRAAESKNPKCKKIEKTVDYSDDYASFTEPDDDYDPSTYQGRYKRQARQGRQGGRQGGRQAPKRPMTCYVCEDENGRYAERCSYDSNGSPKNGAYFHSESTSFSDKGRRPNSGSSNDRQRRSGNRQRQGDAASSESTTKAVSINPEDAPEIAESEPKVIDKRQSGGGYEGDEGEGFGRGNNPNNDGFGDPYDSRTGTYRNPTGYEGPPLGPNPRSSGNPHSGGRGGGGGDRSTYGSFDNDFDYGPEFEREAGSASREYDFSIPREFDPDVQLRGGSRGGGGGGQGGGHHGGGGGRQEGGGGFHGGSSGGGGGGRSNNPHQQFHTPSENRRSSPGYESTSASSRNENLDAFEVGYNDYLRQHFPEILNTPAAGGFRDGPEISSSPSGGFSTSSYPTDYEYRPNYYHRPRGDRDNNNREQGPEISHSPSNNQGRGNRGGHSHGFVPDREHTQPSHNFSPPPGFFSEDSPAQENQGNLGSFVKEFSSRSRDGCRKVNKGDMTCYVCRDARGMNKEECMYASNDPKNKAMAYHEVTEYSSPTVSVIPAPEQRQEGFRPFHAEGPIASGSSVSFASARASGVPPTVASPTQKAKKDITSGFGDKDKHSVKSTRFAHSSTVIVHERSKRSPREDDVDFDY